MIVPGLEKTLAEHKKWLESNFEEGKPANLHRTYLCDADLRGVNIDYLCWPLWCGSFDVIVDRRIAAQLAYHFCRVICDDPEVIQCQKALYKLANTFHRVGELPHLGDD